MNPVRCHTAGALALALCLAAATAAAAASLQTFLDELRPAYDSVCKAVFYLERGAAAPAGFVIASAGEAWRSRVLPCAYRKCDAAAPPDVSSAPSFRRMIDGTLTSLDRMWDAIAAGDQQTVVNILREVRSFDRLLWLHHG